MPPRGGSISGRLPVRTDTFRELTRGFPEACFLLSAAGELLAVNPAAAAMLGMEGSLTRGRRIGEFLLDPAGRVSHYLTTCLRNRSPVPGALNWQRGDGQSVPCHCSGHLIVDSQDERLILLRCEPKDVQRNEFTALNRTLEQVRGANHRLVQQSEALRNEIDERIQAEVAARESMEMLLTVLDSLDAMVYVSDMESYQVIFVNKYVKDLFGEVEGKLCWQTLQAGQTGPCPFCSNARLVDAAGKPTGLYTWEFFNTRIGRWFHLADRAVNWVDGRVVRLEIATDITEMKLAEEKIRRLNEELELRVNKRTIELEVKNRELQRMNKLFVGRELKMIELKGRIRELERENGGAGDETDGPT